MDDKSFWIAIRAALLAMVAAIEQKWHIGKGKLYNDIGKESDWK